MDRDIVNAIHRMYYAEVDRQELLADLWSPDSAPDLEALANLSDGKMSLPRQLTFFLKAVETQMASLPNPNFVFSFPLSQRPRKPDEKRPAFVAMPYGPKWSDSVKTVSSMGLFKPSQACDIKMAGSAFFAFWGCAMYRSNSIPPRYGEHGHNE